MVLLHEGLLGRLYSILSSLHLPVQSGFGSMERNEEEVPISYILELSYIARLLLLKT